MIRVYDRDGRSGFHMKFPNGWAVSVQIGYGNYCDNRDQDSGKGPHTECANAEIAAIDKNGKFYRLTEHDNVDGYVEPEKIAEFILMVSRFTGDADEMNAIQEVHYG